MPGFGVFDSPSAGAENFREVRMNPFRKSAPLLACLVASWLSPQASAENMGEASHLDKRVQTAVYTPDNVFRLQAMVGRSSLIQFPANETVNEDTGLITSGDPQAWTLGVNKAGNMVAIKPSSDQDPDTNLIINTNKHTYLLELKLVKKVTDMTYALRFVLPEPPKNMARIDAPANPCSGLENRNWQSRGNKDLAPSEVWDNGTFTCFRFATNKPRPNLYQVMPDGTESVVATRNEQNILVAHGVSSLFRLRLNNQVLDFKTQLQATPYNFKGTTTGEVRTLKDRP
jgi:type IV secretion system protein VirB9